jgi:hypothetical protein
MSIVVFTSLFLLFVDIAVCVCVCVRACVCACVRACVVGRAMPHCSGVPYGMRCPRIKQAKYQS